MADSSPGINRSAPKFTRCRTGCLRCRKRRRKCDEGKPRCQNCIDKDFVCNYGLQVTFLPKNSITVTAGELRVPKSDTTNYNKIQFVNEDPLSTENVADVSTEGPLSPVSSVSSTPFQPCAGTITAGEEDGSRSVSEQHTAGPEEYDNSNGRDTYRGAPSTLAPWELDSYNDHLNGQSVPPEQQITQSTFSAKDEFAVQGLLALGTQSGADAIPAIPDTTSRLDGLGPDVGTPLAASSHRSATGISPETDSNFIERMMGVSTPAVRPHLDIDLGINNETWKLELLQHYRYHVAPWLDICDLKHSFGITALQMAVDSERLLSALMSLSEACLQKTRGLQTTNLNHTITPSALPSIQSCLELHPRFTEAMLLRAFEELRCLVLDTSRTWGNTTSSGYGPLDSLAHTAYGLDIDSAIYWMLLRIDLGRALANNIPIQIPLPSIPIPSLSLLCRAEETHERVGHYAQVLLWLCGKALILYHQDSIPQQPHQFTESWLKIFEELNEWHYQRPQEFQPMVEIHGEDEDLNPGSQFPMVLFTNGAGALCNQLYHTAMLLVLERKPRTALLNSSHSPMLSTLWHAQRVCGIALNNDRRECWDPCLLASFLVAARHMTHEFQQLEIRQGFARIEEITGWDVGDYLEQLSEEWSFLEGGE